MVNPESIRQPFWSMAAEEVLRVLATRAEGLTEEEAALRLQQFGANAVPSYRRLTRVRIIAHQFQSPLILILIAAGVLTAVLGEWVETGVIAAAVVANTLLGFWQESKAETVLGLLKTYLRTRTRVRRDGQEREVDATTLVPGDTIRIRQGDRVPADARLIYANNLEVDESVLTGESLPVAKDPAPRPAATILAERTPMLYGGTLMVQGFGDALVTATGAATEFGRIAALVGAERAEPTPLQRSLGRFASQVGVALVSLTLILFAVGLASGKDPFEMFLIAVAVAVAAVPEGLPVALTVILAVGVERLARRKGIVRKLLAAEALGSTTLILTDKTGTLTQAKMEVASVLPFKGSSTEAEVELLRGALLNADAVVENPDAAVEEWQIVGRPLEVALIRAAGQRGIRFPELLRAVLIQDRLPFTSANKYSAVLYRGQDSSLCLAVWGAPEVVLGFSALSGGERQQVLQQVEERARAGERVLAVASIPVTGGEEVRMRDLRWEGLNFHGILTLRDPLRPHVAQAIREIRQAGVRTVIVTGDHRGTAEAVARELGLVDGKGAVLTGEDLKSLESDELAARSNKVSVYARVTPEQKVMLTKLYQGNGEVVAVTGDGVNDAPALEQANIGIAVGSGTDVAKAAADLVILDDNFETIVAAIEEGRRILQNIRKVVVYLLSDALDEVLLIGGAILAGLPLPLNALQILFVNFFSDSFPAVAFAFEQGADGTVSRRSPERSQGVFDRTVRFLILGIGILTSLLLFILYFFLSRTALPADTVRTFIFASFATYTLFLAFSVRSLEKSILHYNPFSNRYLLVGVGIGILLTLAVVYLPVLQRVFGTVRLPLPWLGAVAAVGVFNILAVELGKWLIRNR